MNLATGIILALVILAVVLALRSLWKGRGHGCSSCSGCDGCCSSCQIAEKKTPPKD